MDDISPRKRIVLSAIISMHTADGEPVGSKSLLTGHTPLNVSSATLRSEMAALTDIGLLHQPHISAGRVPTIEGYKYYVHKLMPRYHVGSVERDEIRNAVNSFDSDPDRACEEAAALLARVTGLAGFATAPEGVNHSIAHYELIRAGRYSIAVVGVTESGGVRTRVCRLPCDITSEELAGVSSLLNSCMVFVPHPDATHARLEQICSMSPTSREKTAPIIRAAEQVLAQLDKARVYVKGTENLLAYRELDMAELLKFMSNERQLRNIVRRTGDTVTAFVADETGSVFSDSISVVVGRYRIGNGLGGGIGVVGPLRTNYEYVIPRLQCFCEMLSSLLIGG